MSGRAKEMAERIRVFNNEVISFVENCTEENWRKLCPAEDWTVGVVARHIGAGHYGAVSMAKLIVQGQKLPEVTGEQIVRMANDHARNHADCSKSEVLGVLREQGAAVTDYILGLSDEELDRTSYFLLFGGEVSAWKFIENVILVPGGGHFESMKAAAGA